MARHLAYFTCATAVASAYAHPGQRIIYYLLSDSHALKEEALRLYPDRVVVSGLSQSHPEIESAPEGWGWEGIKGAADGMMGSVAEMWTFAGESSWAEEGGDGRLIIAEHVQPPTFRS